MTDASGVEMSHPLRYGEPFGVALTGPRRCIGIWRGETRSCPFDSPIEADQGGAQCRACAGADPGRALARDATVDPRAFRLYLAAFGAGVLKVGITAVDRGTERLLEQGAVAFTWLAQGSHPTIRAAEAAVSGAGMATERPRRGAKLAGWWQHDGRARRHEALVAVAEAAHRLSAWPVAAGRVEVDVVDYADLYGLADLPDHVDDVDQVTSAAVFAGRVRAVIGPEILLDHVDHSGFPESAPGRGLVISGRRLAGWPIAPTGTAGGGYTTRTVEHAGEPSTDEVTDAAQHALF